MNSEIMAYIIQKHMNKQYIEYRFPQDLSGDIEYSLLGTRIARFENAEMTKKCLDTLKEFWEEIKELPYDKQKERITEIKYNAIKGE